MFLLQSGPGVRIYKAILPDKAANEVAHDAVVFAVLAQKIRSLSTPLISRRSWEKSKSFWRINPRDEGYIIASPVGQELESGDG